MGLMMPQQQQHHGPAIYNYNHHSQQYGGYWYPPDYQYQQVMLNNQAMQHYYAQMYGLPSPTAPAPPPYHHQYLGYVPTPSPRAVLSPAPPQIAAQPYVPLQAAAQMQGSFLQLPSLPHNFALQLPPHAVSSMLPPNPTDLQTAGGQAYSAASATNPNNNAHQGA